MKTIGKTLRSSVAAALFFTGLIASVHGDVGGFSFGPGGERGIQIRGNIVCTECSLEEARNARLRGNALYQLTHTQGRLVMQVNWVSNSTLWNSIVWPPHLRVRGDDSLLRQLSAEEHLFKEVEISGLLGHLRTLDLVTINVKG
jgi:hypothetical protein